MFNEVIQSKHAGFPAIWIFTRRIKNFKTLQRIEGIDEVSEWILKLTLQSKLIF